MSNTFDLDSERSNYRRLSNEAAARRFEDYYHAPDAALTENAVLDKALADLPRSKDCSPKPSSLCDKIHRLDSDTSEDEYPRSYRGYRKRKGPMLNNAFWEGHRDRITELYITENLTLHKVKKIMKQEAGLVASDGQYRRILSVWCLNKANLGGYKRPEQASTSPFNVPATVVPSDLPTRDIQLDINEAWHDQLREADSFLEKSEFGFESGAPQDRESSESDDSLHSDQRSHLTTLEVGKQELLENLMAYFHTMFRSASSRGRLRLRSTSGRHLAAPMEGSNEQDTPCNDHNRRSSAGSFRGGLEAGSLSSKGKGKRARSDDNDDNPEDDGDEQSSSKKQRGTGNAEDLDTGKLFACPYYQRDPEMHRTRRSCVWPGYAEVRRVKDHLYRSHRQELRCPRCYERFESDTLLQAHQRADAPCAKSTAQIPPGLNKDQEKALRSRKRCQPGATEEDKWRRMYRILFPHDDDTIMPSPYVDVNWDTAHQKRDSEDELARYEQYLRRELPPAVRLKLEIQIEQAFENIEEKLRGQLVEIARDAQLQLFESYIELRHPHLPRGPVAATTETQDQERQRSQDADNTNAGLVALNGPNEATLEPILDHLASYEAPPLMDNLWNYGLNGVLFDLQDCSTSNHLDDFQDSAYQSGASNFMTEQEDIGVLSKFDEDLSCFNFGFLDDFTNNGEGPSGTRS